MRAISMVGVLVLAACGSDGEGGGAGDGGADAGLLDVTESFPGAEPIAPAAECRVVTWREPSGARDHRREPCSELAYPTHPPAAGAHYSVWADFGTYDAPVPWGYLVHSLEHGAIVLAYDCPEGCDEALAALEGIVAEHPADPKCESHDGVDARFVLVPDPELPDGSIAAVAWEHVYLATCLDLPSLRAFVEERYAQAPEDLCVAGLDGSADGWCE